MHADLKHLSPCFLGPAAENADLLEKLLLEFVRDHVYWRRNFHPEDGPAIPPQAASDPDHLEFVSRTKTELYRLSSELKRAVPFFHPRYIGHMSSDQLLPGVLARLVTTLYNPNNVSEDAAPATLDKELACGEQLARLFGFSTDESQEPCAWGHLTSGGTVANYEGLWTFRSVRLYPLALVDALRQLGFSPPGFEVDGTPLMDATPWQLFNMTLGDVVELRQGVARAYVEAHGHGAFRAYADAVKHARVESLGTAEFFRRHAEHPVPIVMVPASAHYSWEKAMKILGLGTAQLRGIPVDRHMRMDVTALDAALKEARAAQQPVLGLVGVLGTTEFGTIDPIHEILRVRGAHAAAGLYAAIHVDAAWGGYLTTLFRERDGSCTPREQMRQRFAYFPSKGVYDAFAALREVDSITVDPHKMGYVPYAAGAYVARDRRTAEFVTQKAAYVFDVEGSAEDVPMGERLKNLGQYILEGSKPGSAAASVYVTHNVLPLDREGFGRILEPTIRASEVFFDHAEQARQRLADRVKITVPFEPDTNLVCLVINPAGNTDLAEMNRFGRALFSELKVDPTQPVQMHRFIGSYTSLLYGRVPEAEASRILDEVGIDAATFVEVPQDEARESDHIFVLRHTLMNPWLLREREGRTYIDAYWDWLQAAIERHLDAGF